MRNWTRESILEIIRERYKLWLAEIGQGNQ